MRGPGYAPHSALEKLSLQLPHVSARSPALLVGSFGHVCLCAITTAFSPPFQGMLALCPCVFARACKYIAMSLLFVLLALCVHSVLMSHLLSSAVLACFSADGTVSVAAM